MMYVLTPDEMRAADAEACARTGARALMREAGARIAEFVRAHYDSGRIVAFAGPGNNGGDAFAAFAELDSHYERVIYAVGDDSESEARCDARMRAENAGVAIARLPARDAEIVTALDGAVLAVDALFGTGGRQRLGEAFRGAARALDARRLPVLAIDIPSGVDGLTGSFAEDSVRASTTLALGALKPGLLLDRARERCGDIWLADIGIPDTTLQRFAMTFAALDDAAFVQLLPTRAPGGDKRSAGAPLVVAGSEQFPGAAVLCALGAARAGAGYVTVATPAAAAPILRAHLVEQVVVTFPGGSPEAAAEELLDVAKRNSSVAVGPGLSLDEWTGTMLRHFLERVDLPVVVDAGAFFHLGKHLEILRGKHCVLTPHESEFARLSGKGTIAPGQRVTRLREFVERTAVTTLLKGQTTLVFDGTITAINTTGTQALATAGTGDVLTGIIATLLAQGCSPFDAARTGAYWHGLAGLTCAAERSVGVIAGDLPGALADAIPTQYPQRALRRVVPF